MAPSNRMPTRSKRSLWLGMIQAGVPDWPADTPDGQGEVNAFIVLFNEVQAFFGCAARGMVHARGAEQSFGHSW